LIQTFMELFAGLLTLRRVRAKRGAATTGMPVNVWRDEAAISLP